MEIIKNKEFYFSKILEDLGMFDIVDLLDEMVSFLDIEYHYVYDPHFHINEITLDVDNFIMAFTAFDKKTEKAHEELHALYEIALMHKDSGEDDLYLEF